MAKSAEVKLAIFGRAGVGKSALVVRFLTKRFIWEYDPTLGRLWWKGGMEWHAEVVSVRIISSTGRNEQLCQVILRGQE
uniref:small monomeric GTPase n=1 Tax=Cyanistes caeruleus TaxID=156563 RepID=A0A8C0UQ81_CYACU